MPVTIKTASHRASKTMHNVSGLPSLLDTTHISNSFSSYNKVKNSNVIVSANGFVHAAIDAHRGNHHLSIRPEDVWFAILSQLNIWINANAEEARVKFIAHEGKNDLTVTFPRSSGELEELASEMARKIEKTIINPELMEWIMPTFTTTNATDTIVASTLIMGAVERHFKTYFHGLRGCRLPSVNLLGEQSDWEELYKKLDKLESFGVEPAQFGTLLKPIVSRFVGTFQHPTNIKIVEFWNHMISAQHQSSGSGEYVEYEGWISAFCFWNEQENMKDRHIQFRGGRGYNLDDVIYHTIDTREIPPGYASLPAKVGLDGKEHDCIMVAGSVGMQLASAGGGGTFPFYGLFSGPGFDSVSPKSDWWMFRVSEISEANAASQENLADGTEPTESASHQQSAISPEVRYVNDTSRSKNDGLMSRLANLFSRADISE
ncbi:hypothetical protein IMSHALPRED_006504 [Imshaugia aleurites]|uniref:Uncharacterized protein n=1 Tax=Imshaugia aleurites TaxID=172621 RepID=A0A8H3I585_9LECA|nr:hypothetical protein IMSHALPRED_006504 [Imshaugia aleurites]